MMCFVLGVFSSTVLATQWAFSIWKFIFFSPVKFFWKIPWLISFPTFSLSPLSGTLWFQCWPPEEVFIVSRLPFLCLLICSEGNCFNFLFHLLSWVFPLLLSCFKSLFSELYLFLFHECNIILITLRINGRAFCFCFYIFFSLNGFHFPQVNFSCLYWFLSSRVESFLQCWVFLG